MFVSSGFTDFEMRISKRRSEFASCSVVSDRYVFCGANISDDGGLLVVSDSVLFDDTNLSGLFGSDIEDFSKVDGNLSVVYHKKGTDDLLVVGDYLGRLPIYYYYSPRTLFGNARLLISDQLKVFSGLPYSSVKLLKSGHYLKYSGGVLIEAPYYTLSRDIVDLDEEALVSRIKDSLYAATEKVIRRFGSKCCVFLSGGIDSSTIASIAAKILPGIEAFTFSVGIKGNKREDFGNAKRVAEHLGLVLHEVVVAPEDVMSVLSDVVNLNEDFSWTQITSAIGQYFLAREASKLGFTVALCGDLSDEVFASYPQIERWNWRDEQYVKARTQLMKKAYVNMIRSVKVLGNFGVIFQDPFSDKDFVELASNVPPKYKDGTLCGKRVNKYLLRKAFECDLPQEIVLRTKGCQGQVTNTDELFDSAEGREMISELFSSMFNDGGVIR